MSTPNNQPSELPNTYVIQDHSHETEVARLHVQDQLLTASMGGVLPEQPDATIFRQVLDVGCGTGDWLIAAAKRYPTMQRLVGIDTSGQVILYARAQAEAQQVADRVEFHVMDALRMLEFPEQTFDLVNQRLGMSYLRTWDWTKLLGEYHRVARKGGVIRVTEGTFGEYTSPALTHLYEMLRDTFYQAGHLFAHESDGLINQLAPLLHQQRFQNVQTQTHRLLFQAGTHAGENFAKNTQQIFRLIKPFIEKWIRLPEEYDELYQQALQDMQQPDFAAKWTLLTAWGSNPPRQKAATVRSL